jgi:pentatricopeptide repeat protein
MSVLAETLGAMWEQIAEGVGAAQTEIVIFVIAFLTHALFMGKLRIPRKSKLVANPKSAMAKVKSVEDPGPSGRKSPRSESNTMEARLKGCIQEGELKKSQKVLDEMRAAGLQPGRATFNDLLVVAVHCSIEDGCDVVEEMRSCGMKLDRVSCSILLKCIQRDTKSADIMRILSLLDEMDGETDEVLLNSFVDACIRVGRSDLLSAQLRKQRSSSKSCFKSLHTYGSLIRASGYAGDIAGVWETWRDMRKNRITPTSVTLGCMVEALTSNGETDASYELLHEMLSDPACKPMVNAVIYGTVLKGFSHAKKFDRVWSIYQNASAQSSVFDCDVQHGSRCMRPIWGHDPYSCFIREHDKTRHKAKSHHIWHHHQRLLPGKPTCRGLAGLGEYGVNNKFQTRRNHVQHNSRWLCTKGFV